MKLKYLYSSQRIFEILVLTMLALALPSFLYAAEGVPPTSKPEVPANASVPVPVPAPVPVPVAAAAADSTAAPGSNLEANVSLRNLLSQAATQAQLTQVETQIKGLLSKTPSSKADEASRDQERLSQLQFGAGLVAYRLGRNAEAGTHFTEFLTHSNGSDDYAHFYLALVAEHSGDFENARKNYVTVLEKGSGLELQTEARLALAKLMMNQKNPKAALPHLQQLAKRLRSSDRYAEVLYYELMASQSLRSGSVCKIARDLYAKYPSEPLISGWGFFLEQNSTPIGKLSCRASSKDSQTRIKRLQWGGELDKALKELQSLRDQTPESDRYSVDAMIANVYVNDGRADEALKILADYYSSQSSRSGYLLLLAKAASRAGEQAAALSAYEKVYRMSPGSRVGKNAAFQAAFLSYQFQDYDGASRRFDELVRKYGTSGLGRDAKWHLAWIRYLKGDYVGALNGFAGLGKLKPTIRRRRVRRGHRQQIEVVASDSLSAERIRYWTAMANLRLGRIAEAKTTFLQMARDPNLGYYAVASHYRLRTLPASSPSAGNPTGSPAANLANNPAHSPAPPQAMAQTPNTESFGEEPESEETLMIKENHGADGVAANDEQADEQDDEAVVDRGLDPEAAFAKGFSDRDSTRRFNRARFLVSVGLDGFARSELSEIERHARATADVKNLLRLYQVAQFYFRSSYLAEVNFGAERIRGGLDSSRPLWEAAFPRAYESAVLTQAKTLGVPEELIWGIMRAESHYRTDAQSPVGALGLMQLMPFTSKHVAQLLGDKDFRVSQLTEAETNIKIGSRYLARLQEKFKGSLPLIAAAYNAGPHRVSSWLGSFGLLDMDEFIEHIPFVETRNYAKKVVRFAQTYQMLYGKNDQPKPDAARAGSESEGAWFSQHVGKMTWLAQPVGLKFESRVSLHEEVW